MNPNLGLTAAQREGVVNLLRPLLADEFLLYTKTRNAHWNVVGSDFHALHKWFEEQYGALAETVDEVAERIRTLGAHAPGTLVEFLKLTRLKESPGKYPDAAGWIRSLLADHEAIIREMREDLQTAAEKFEDSGTSDFLTSLMEDHEKTAWMLRASLAQ